MNSASQNLLIALVLFSVSVTALGAGAVTDAPTSLPTLYRQIEATPHDVVYALTQDTGVAKSENSSRLEKYFNIESKDVSVSGINMQVRANARYMPTSLKNYLSMLLHLERLADADSHPRFHVKFILAKAHEIEGVMTLLPLGHGSQVKLEMQKTNMPRWMISAALGATISLGLASTAPTSTK